MSPGARELIEAALGGTAYLDRALELLDTAARGNSSECCAVWSEHGGVANALALVGLVAGASGAGRVHLLVGDSPRIVAQACDVLRAMGARFAMAEWPDDAAFAAAILRLRADGFHEVARVSGFYRPGVDQVFLRRDL
jgi:hypothetical protein